MSGTPNSNLKKPKTNLLESSGRPFTMKFSDQSGAVQSFQNRDERLNVPNMQGSLASINAEVTGLPSSKFQQHDGTLYSGRFVSNHPPMARTQMASRSSQIHSEIASRGGNNGYLQSMNMHQNEQNFHGNGISVVQNQQIPFSKAARGSLATLNQPHHQLQMPQNQQQLHDSGGVSFPSTSTQDHLYMRGGFDPYPSTFHRQTSGSSINPYAHLNQQFQQDHNQFPVRLQQNMVAATQLCRDQILMSSETSTGHFTPSDRYGVLGLDEIRVNNTDIASLASGIDLRTLGLDLRSKDVLYENFASPWADGPVEEEPEYVVPEYYNATPPLPLHRGYFKKFRLHTLFYIFYSMPKDEAQLYAADELRSRGWLYHKKEQLWLTRTSKMKPLVRTASYEQGTYFYFDLKTWDVHLKENFLLNYDDLDLTQQA